MEFLSCFLRRNFFLTLSYLVAFLDAAFESQRSVNHHPQSILAKLESRLVNGLWCQPCNVMHCPVKKLSKLRCRGGLALDVCECCSVCARVENERCGGRSKYLGTCDVGLYCHDVPQKFGANPDQAHGICVKRSVSLKSVMDILTPADEASQDTAKDVCQPKCTSDFCTKNPRAICSAFDNADQSKPCQETCQHTSCMACRFVQPDSEPCPKCEKDDFPCIRKYGRCVRRQSCRKRKFPCSKKHIQNETSKFQCSVSDCLQT